jgi:hypothetical protein
LWLRAMEERVLIRLFARLFLVGVRSFLLTLRLFVLWLSAGEMLLLH